MTANRMLIDVMEQALSKGPRHGEAVRKTARSYNVTNSMISRVPV